MDTRVDVVKVAEPSPAGEHALMVAQRPDVRRSAAVLIPGLLASALWPAREGLDNAVVVLLFTLLVVAFAASGDRVAGLLTALASVAWMDFFLIPPYLTLQIGRGDDVWLALLFAVVGLAVTELALWGRRKAAEAARRSGYVDGVLGILRIDPRQAAGQDRRAAICTEITRVLGIDSCTYAEGAPAGGWPVLTDAGELRDDGRLIDVATSGLPTTSLTATPVRRAGVVVGHFRLVAATRVVRPTPDQLKVAVLLADQAARD